MKSNEDNKTWISNISLRNIFLCLKQVYCCLTFVCVYNSLSQQREHDAKIQITHVQHYKELDILFFEEEIINNAY